MSVTTERPHLGLTWEAFVELPDEQLRHAELHDGGLVPDLHVRIALRWGCRPDLAWYSPDGGFDEWGDGGEVNSMLLDGFAAPVADLLAPITAGPQR